MDNMETPSNSDRAVSSSKTSTEKESSDVTPLYDQPQTSSSRNMGTIRWILTSAALYSATLLYGLDATIVANVQVPIVERFGDIESLTWIGAAFPLGSVVVIMPLGVMYGLFDSKWMYISSFIFFEAGSALCGGAPNMNALIIGRVIAGMGGSGLYLGNLNIFASLTSIRERPVYMAGAGLCWGAGAILGPVVGGAFANSSATWRWAFYINLVVAALSGPVYISLPSIQPKPAVSILKKIAEIDFLGTCLYAGIFVLFIIPLTLAEGQWAWGDANTIVCLALCAVFTVAFVAQQAFSVFTTPEQRIFPVDLLRSRTMILMFIATAGTSTNLFVPVYYIPLYFQFTRGDDPMEAAVRLLPFILIGVTTTMISGSMMPKLGFYMPWYVLSGVTSVLGASLMYTVKTSTSAGALYGYSIPIAIGAGSSLQIGYSVSQAIIPAAQQSAAIRFINSAQLGGTTIALTIAGRVFQTYAFRNVKDALGGLNFTDGQIAAAIAGAQGDLLESLTTERREAVFTGIVEAIAKAYILVMVGGSVTLICSFFMKREKLFQKTNALVGVQREESKP